MAIAHWRGDKGTATYTEQSVPEHLSGTACLASYHRAVKANS